MGSTMLQMSDSVGSFMNGSMVLVSGSGNTSMSLAWIGIHPRIEEPSKPSPSSKTASVSSAMGMVKCCHSPRKSMNFRSTITAFLSCAYPMTSLAFGIRAPGAALAPAVVSLYPRAWARGSRRTIVQARYQARRFAPRASCPLSAIAAALLAGSSPGRQVCSLLAEGPTILLIARVATTVDPTPLDGAAGAPGQETSPARNLDHRVDLTRLDRSAPPMASALQCAIRHE